MKDRSKVLMILFTYIIILFGPYIYLDEVSFSLINLLFKPSSAIFLIILTIYLLLFTFTFLYRFFFKNKPFYILIDLISIALSTFLPFICQYYLCSVSGLSFGPSYYLLFVLFLINIFVFNRFNDFALSFTLKDITEIGIFIALAIVLDSSFLKFKPVPNGGSVSFVMIPLIVLVLRKGFKKGFVSLGFIYATINCFRDGWGLYTFPFDYFLAFSSLSIVALFKKFIFTKDNSFKIKSFLILLLSCALSLCLRILSHTISGMLFYDLNFISSLIYQLTYMVPSSIFTLVGIAFLYKPLLMIQKMYPNS